MGGGPDGWHPMEPPPQMQSGDLLQSPPFKGAQPSWRRRCRLRSRWPPPPPPPHVQSPTEEHVPDPSEQLPTPGGAGEFVGRVDGAVVGEFDGSGVGCPVEGGGVGRFVGGGVAGEVGGGVDGKQPTLPPPHVQPGTLPQSPPFSPAQASCRARPRDESSIDAPRREAKAPWAHDARMTWWMR